MCASLTKFFFSFPFCQPLESWTVNNVIEWMAALNLYRFAELFREKQVTGEDLKVMDADKLHVSSIVYLHIPASCLIFDILLYLRWKSDEKCVLTSTHPKRKDEDKSALQEGHCFNKLIFYLKMFSCLKKFFCVLIEKTCWYLNIERRWKLDVGCLWTSVLKHVCSYERDQWRGLETWSFMQGASVGEDIREGGSSWHDPRFSPAALSFPHPWPLLMMAVARAVPEEYQL